MAYKKPPPEKRDQSMYFELSHTRTIMPDFKEYEDECWTEEEIEKEWIEKHGLLVKVLYNIILQQLEDYLGSLKRKPAK